MKHNKFFQNHTPNPAGIIENSKPSRDPVATRAYLIYLNHGSHDGQDVQDWREAEAQLIAEQKPEADTSENKTDQFMQKSTPKLTKTPQAPSLQTVVVRSRSNRHDAAPAPKPKKRENTFSKSRDIREDRGTRQAKTSNNQPTSSHGRR